MGFYSFASLEPFAYLHLAQGAMVFTHTHRTICIVRLCSDISDEFNAQTTEAAWFNGKPGMEAIIEHTSEAGRFRVALAMCAFCKKHMKLCGSMRNPRWERDLKKNVWSCRFHVKSAMIELSEKN